MTQRIAVLGAGAFGTALAITLAAGGQRVSLWGRDAAAMAEMAGAGENARHLPGCAFPEGLSATADLTYAAAAPMVLLAVPTQALRGLLESLPENRSAQAGQILVLCCKGIERGTGLLPADVVQELRPGARTAILTGPSFAAELAAGLPTAVTLATTDPAGAALQESLASPALRPYLSDDPVGAQFGGALKNVVAIAAGISDGAGMGDSARAALITRGFAEIARHAEELGARRETLFGLSGLGDLILTCTSDKSRNYRHGRAIGAGQTTAQGVTVEGVATAAALSDLLPDADLPVTHCVAAVVSGRLDVQGAVDLLMSRPLKREG